MENRITNSQEIIGERGKKLHNNNTHKKKISSILLMEIQEEKEVKAGICWYQYITDLKDYPTGRKTHGEKWFYLNSTMAKSTFSEYQ